MNPVDRQRRHALGEFLRMARSRVDPATAGFQVGRRRTPGLRREEVAQLANVSATWYTWLEQGRDIQPSEHVLVALAKALRLKKSERDYVFGLGRRSAPAIAALSPHAPGGEATTPELETALDDLIAAMWIPTYITDRRWNILSYNRAADAVFGISGLGERNMMRLLFTHPRAQTFLLDWADSARRLVCQFRAMYSLASHDQEFLDLVAELCAASPDFDRWWHEYQVETNPSTRHRFRHPVAGELTLDSVPLRSFSDSDFFLATYVPVGATTRETLTRLLSWDRVIPEQYDRTAS
ncbi:helix-turn-helix transcriptional regulator [Allokutzneria sp. A3M-2-11 16]|uniref:helix-turn-helix transcriptional regulator n=1 Tax=Allokutzneria sp. A3M-2-11 16 TaxID=2962043 RepID=UPI0020B772C4|nr:helix-turn-helix transcriptional regulator [Allokutzneria sp. A3M-2-11 16]MCP3803144.1 helix-turn-helix transcriptional regulator [Allokutzneria sp. A3M-2-11 16]